MLTIPRVVVLSSRTKMHTESGPGLIELLTQLTKAFHKRTS